MNPKVACYILGAAFGWALIVVLVCRSIYFEITPDSIVFESFWRKRRAVRYSDIGSAVMINYRYVTGGRDYSGNRSPRMWTLVVTPKVSTGEKQPGVDWSAHCEIVRLLDPQEWAPD